MKGNKTPRWYLREIVHETHIACCRIAHFVKTEKARPLTQEPVAHSSRPLRENDAYVECAYFRFHEPIPQFVTISPLDYIFFVNKIYMSRIVRICTMWLSKEIFEDVR